MITIRFAQETDLPELMALFRQTVLTHAPQHYTPAQTKAWAASVSDRDRFHSFIFGVTTYVATRDNRILGFTGISAAGHVASVYVRHDCLHQGIGSKLLETLLNHAYCHHLQRLYAEASEFSLGLFTKFGFHLHDTEMVERQGIQFKRYLVERYL
ncbi:MAG: GNAT family N-acetyltransferase [Cyanobacteria bacterium J06559_3]